MNSRLLSDYYMLRSQHFMLMLALVSVNLTGCLSIFSTTFWSINNNRVLLIFVRIPNRKKETAKMAAAFLVTIKWLKSFVANYSNYLSMSICLPKNLVLCQSWEQWISTYKHSRPMIGLWRVWINNLYLHVYTYLWLCNYAVKDIIICI